ncbi:glycosyltransferase family 39 protein [Crocosphaera sp.]|uniref:ArnT family glycosyltransferase n=1 Tax=Crocosphaera sp. TaxID=2729996 RepID=UPI0026260C32|nr:glycosyltransferase family 39 protein [Crocosphaera sp.]MDJ0581340.1 glycosyltransferase family 39 protein [Crocosphaera sp.]
MNSNTFTWHPLQSLHPHSDTWRNIYSWAGLLGIALILFTSNLNGSPLLDSERIISQLVTEMAQTSFLSGDWLFPTLQGQPYHQHPVLGLFLLTLNNGQGELHPGSLRLVGAIFASFSVPLLYAVAREIFVLWRPSVLSALVYLMLFPVVRCSRLATLDGIVLFWSILTVLCVLRSRRDFRWSLALGLSLSGLFLTQGLIACLLTITLMVFLAWDTPRLLSSIYFWMGVSLGILPALTWYWMEWLVYGNAFLTDIFFHSFQRGLHDFFVSLTYYPLAIIKYCWPWLIFACYGLRFAWQSLNWGWAKLILVWAACYGAIIVILPLDTMSYLLPFCPALALASGMILHESNYLPHDLSYPKSWWMILLSLSAVASIISLFVVFDFPFALVLNEFDFTLLSDRLFLVLTLITVTLTWGITSTLIVRRNSQFIAVLLWGMYVSLLLVISSPYWTGNNIYF